MRRTVTLMTVVVLVGLLAGPVLAGSHDRRGRTSRDHRVTSVRTHHSSRAIVPAPRRYVLPRTPVVVYPTPVYPTYTTYRPVVVPQPVIYQPVPVVPVRRARSTSLFTIILSW